MANNITQYNSTAGSNTTIDSISIDEGMAASNVNNAIRSLMSHLKNVDTGTQALTALSVTGALSAKGGAVFNEDSADVDFRVESNGNANMLFVDGGNDNVNIGTNSNIAPANGTNLYVEDGTIARFGLNKTGSNARKFSIGNAGTYLNIYDETLDAEVFKIDSTGAITKPLQPAFLATMGASQSNLAINSNLTIQFNSEIFDQNADFDTSTYTFTAPVTGRYQLSFVLRVDNHDASADFYSYFLNTSNRSNYRYLFNPDIGTSAGSDVDRFPALMSMLVDMDANDTANIKVFQSGGAVQTDIISDSYFSGYLVA